MLTSLYPFVEFKEKTWEINEFDCASVFLLEGEEKAMLIDCGMGIGDLKTAVRRLTDKPLVVVITHGAVDHTGNARQFDEIWIHPEAAVKPIPQELARRREDTRMIALREKGRYPYDLNVDLREPVEKMPVIRHISDGMEWDLGGRVVSAWYSPGHSPGHMAFLDEKTRSLFCGDALNYNLGLGSGTIETAVKYLERFRDMGDRYDGIYNGHADFRPLGMPLGDDCLPTAIDLCHQLVDGTYSPVLVPSFWGPAAGRPDRVMVRKGRNYIGFKEELIHDPK